MNPVWVIASITFREAARKKILWTALVVGIGFVIVFGAGLYYQLTDLRNSNIAPFLRYQLLSATLMIGLYTVDLLAVVMTILTSLDTISGEIASGTIQAIATKPVARWQVLIGKWAGFVAMLAVYVGAMFSGTLAAGYWIAGVTLQNPISGGILVYLECLLVLTATFLVGTWFSTLTNGVIVLGLHGAGLSRRVARANERIRAGIGAGDARRGFEPDHAHGSNLAPGGISDAAPIGGRIAVFTICERFRAQRRDGWICRFLHAAYACVSHLPFSASRSVERLSRFLVLLPPAQPCLDSRSPENLPDRDIQKAQNNRAPEGRRESLNVKSRHQ